MQESDASETTQTQLVQYLMEAEQRSKRHHEENIQILVALSIMAGYITAIFNGMFEVAILNLAATMFGLANFAFLFYKVLMTTSIPLAELSSSNRLDPYINLLYILSIIGFSVVLLVSVAVRQLGLELAELGRIFSSAAFFGSPVVIVGGLVYIIGRLEKRATESSGEALRQDLPETLEKMIEGGVVKQSEIDALQDRVERLLEIDEGIGWFRYGGTMMGDSSPARLDRQDREQLLNIVRRIQTKSKHGEFDRQDYELIESIVAEAEQNPSQYRQ